MARVTLDIPSDKMPSFAQAIINLGINSRSIISKKLKKTFLSYQRLANLKKSSSRFILFDWEFFSNELEYE